MIESVLDSVILVTIMAVLGLIAGALMALVGARFLLSDDFPPSIRCRRAEGIALLPIVVALLATLALMLPALLKLAGLIDDHCLAHGLHHPHFFLRHLPAFDVGPVAVLLIGAGTWPMVKLVWTVSDQIRHARLVNAITRLTPPGHRLIMINSETPAAFLLGIRTPKVVLMAGLVRKLSPAERRAVLRHEIAHARAGDLARRLALGWLMSMHFPQTRQRLLCHWH